MYQAKEEGRGHWHMFSDADESLERMRTRVYWKDRVSRALAEDRFVLFFQPILAIESGNVGHYEVLLKMLNDDGSVVGAAQFIDAAERGGVIHAVDRLVVAKAIEALAAINRRGWNVAFSINLSGHVFSDPEMPPHLRRMLDLHKVDPSKVIFEITETAAVADFAVANELMLSIKELGCRFALDDFGIGFSSFYYLKHLPVDFLKIDGSFIRQLPDSIEDQVIVRAISQAAKGFGKITVAEYVESEMTLSLLREYGIDYAQGYLISKPLSADVAFRSLKALEG
jgi:EAL domain-containing protein (putative c-di-GMP-specific phosphodiesterase class I)